MASMMRFTVVPVSLFARANPASAASIDSSLERPPSGCQYRGVPDLSVDDSVGSKIGTGLVSNPLDCLCGLHERNGVLERGQIAHQRTGISLIEPVGKRFRIASRKLVSDLGGELQQRTNPQATVEMVV